VKWAPVITFGLASPVLKKVRGEARSLFFFLILPRFLFPSRFLFFNFSFFFYRFPLRAPPGPNINLFIFNIMRIAVFIYLFTLLLLLLTLFYYYILTNYDILIFSILSRFFNICIECSFVRLNLFRRRNLFFKKNLSYYISR